MTMERLRALSIQQTELILEQLDAEILTPKGEQRGGFVSVRIANARQIVQAFRERGVFTDARADIIRFGPAPYTTDDELLRLSTSLSRWPCLRHESSVWTDLSKH